MKVFTNANIDGEHTCLICHKPKDMPVVLVGIIGTEDERIMEAKQVHVACLELYYYPEQKIIAMKL